MTSLFKTPYRQVSIFASELVELDGFIDRSEREGEHTVSAVQKIGATETGLLLTRALVVKGPTVIARKSGSHPSN